MFSSLEQEIQEKIIDEEIKSYSLVSVDNQKSEFKTEKLKLEALAKVDIINAVKELRAKCRTQKEADFTFSGIVQFQRIFKRCI